MDLKWRPGGSQIETKIEEIRIHFAVPSQNLFKGGFGEEKCQIRGPISSPGAPKIDGFSIFLEDG